MAARHNITSQLRSAATAAARAPAHNSASLLPPALPRPSPRGGLSAISTTNLSHCTLRPIRSFSSSSLHRLFTSPTSSTPSSSPDRPVDRSGTTHFGFEDGVSEKDKTERVAGVFHSVAESYDRMNDLMSFGWHRVWKHHFTTLLSPGLSPGLSPTSTTTIPPSPQHILDVAGGTGDIAFRLLHTAHVTHRNPNVRVTISDINASMLAVGESRATSLLPASQRAALRFLPADATALPRDALPDGSVDLYTVAFGMRNFSNLRAGLAEAHRVLRPGGVFACLEFSRVRDHDDLFRAAFAQLYRRWSFSAIPLIGQLVAGDRDSYQYLVESIARFPDQETFRDLIVEAGFEVVGKGYEDLTGGVAAVHRGVKPLR